MLSWIRAADWLNASRVEGYARAIVMLYVPGVAFLLLVAIDILPIRGGVTGTDFVSFWTAARLVLEGKNPYDLDVFFAAQSGSTYAFLYPPPFLLALLPFGALPYLAALACWTLIGTSAFVLSSREIAPSSIWPILAMPAILINVGHAQNGAVIGTLFVWAVLTIDKRPFLAGIFLGCLIIKPHMALLFPVAFLFGRQWSVIVGGFVGSVISALLSAVVLGPQMWFDFLAKGSEAVGLLETNELLLPKLVSIFGATRTLGGPIWLAYLLQAVAAAIAAACVAYAWARLDTKFAMAVLAVGAVIATPFIYSYDLLILIIPFAWLARDGLTHGFAPWVKLIMVVAFWIPLFDRIIAVQFGINPAFLCHSALLLALFLQYLSFERTPTTQPKYDLQTRAVPRHL